jgi:hypothetical protein
MRQAVESTTGAIPRRCCKYKGKIPGLSGLKEALFQRLDDFVGRSDTDEPGRGHGIAGTDDGNRLRGVDDLVTHQAAARLPNASV